MPRLPAAVRFERFVMHRICESHAEGSGEGGGQATVRSLLARRRAVRNIHPGSRFAARRFRHGHCGIRAASQTVVAGRSRTGGLSVASADTQRIRPYSGPFEIAPFRAGGVPRPEMRARLRRNGLPAEIPIPTPFAVLTRLSENDKRGCPRLVGQPLFHTTAASMPLRTTPAQAAE